MIQTRWTMNVNSSTCIYLIIINYYEKPKTPPTYINLMFKILKTGNDSVNIKIPQVLIFSSA